MIQQAYLLEKQVQELDENFAAIENELLDLKRFEEGIDVLDKSKEQNIISSIGKGVYAKAELSDRELFVEVGKGLIVKKSHKETKELIEKQVKKLEEARDQISGKLGIYREALTSLAEKIGIESEEK